MPGKECADLPPELWGKIAARLPSYPFFETPEQRLVCRAVCKGWDWSRKTVMIKDAFWWPEIGDPTGPEILALLRKMQCLTRIGMNWHTVAGFSAATAAVVQAAEERGKTCQVVRAMVTCPAGPVSICEMQETRLSELLEFVAGRSDVYSVDADVRLV